MTRNVCVVLVVCGLSLAAHGATYVHDGKVVEVEYWAGGGANEAMCVIDFGAQSFAFGYRWDGSATGWDMLSALDSAGALKVESTYWASMNAYSIDALEYGAHKAVSDWWMSFLGYWGSTDGENWTPHAVGVSGRALSNQDWDGWSIEDPSVSWDPLNPPAAPTPEPGTLGLLVIGVAGLLRRRARSA